MAQPFGQTGTADAIQAEYFTWRSSERGFQVHMHLDAINGLARDVIERSEGLPVEAGGLLLGHAGRGEKPVVWVERYQRIECEHRSGPHFILEEDEHRALEQTAVELSRANGELSVVGFYRSHLRPGFQMEAPDFELTDRYFKDAEDLFLLIKPVEKPANTAELVGQFFIREQVGDEIRPTNPSFPFQGRLLRMLEQTPEHSPEHEGDDPRERTGRSGLPGTPVAVTPVPETPPRERLGRLVPDFVPAAEGVRPARDFFMDSKPLPSLFSSTEELNPSQGFLRRRWPILAAVVLVGAGAAAFLQQAAHRNGVPSPAAVVETAAVRPLGLYVDPSSASWRISWNDVPGARTIRLFIHDADDPKTIEISPANREYDYQPRGQDVTLRLEVTDAGGRVSAETYRLVKSVEKVPVAAAPVPVAPIKLTAIKEVAPVVPASIRPRIKGTIPIDVRVKIDERGHVTSATPTIKAHSGLDSFLTERAVAAARQWRFEAGHEGSEIIHFTFKK